MSSEQRPADESANLITHGLGFLLSVLATVYLMRLVIPEQHSRTIIACGVYCSTLVLLYAASTLSHMFHDLGLRRMFRTLDQACIFLLIAGSFTPYAVIFLNHGWWWLLLWAMWGLAFTGVALVRRRRNLSGPAKFSYGVMGWLTVVA
ncbi:MAG: hemolysin III family protein, partial [Planctomycetaceae bacterium]|nr:hemolysin III family protein [Planctomycetaceae bacterium]